MTYEIVSNWLSLNFEDSKIFFVLLLATFIILSFFDKILFNKNKLSLASNNNFSFSKLLFLLVFGVSFYLFSKIFGNQTTIVGTSNIKNIIINYFGI